MINKSITLQNNSYQPTNNNYFTNNYYNQNPPVFVQQNFYGINVIKIKKKKIQKNNL